MRLKRRHKVLRINDPRWESEQGLLHKLTDPPQVDLRMCRLAMVCAKINGSFHSLQLENDKFLHLDLHQRLELGDELLWRIRDVVCEELHRLAQQRAHVLTLLPLTVECAPCKLCREPLESAASVVTTSLFFNQRSMRAFHCSICATALASD